MTPPVKTVEEMKALVALAAFKARCFVSPVHHHEKLGRNEPVDFAFSTRFRGHPWVEASIKEGWDNDLRGHLRMAVKQRILSGQPYDNIESLMPDKEWIAARQHDAKRYRLAAEWRASKAAPVDRASIEASLQRLLGKGNRITGEAAE